MKSSGGTAFFVRVDNAVGYAAVGSAHGFDLELLAQAAEVELRSRPLRPSASRPRAASWLRRGAPS